MKKSDQTNTDITRRDILKTVGAGAIAAAAGSDVVSSSARAAEPRQLAEARRPAGGPYNILFILTDQERLFRPGELPQGFRLPGHERLAQRGVVFENHRINS